MLPRMRSQALRLPNAVSPSAPSQKMHTKFMNIPHVLHRPTPRQAQQQHPLPTNATLAQSSRQGDACGPPHMQRGATGLATASALFLAPSPVHPQPTLPFAFCRQPAHAVLAILPTALLACPPPPASRPRLPLPFSQTARRFLATAVPTPGFLFRQPASLCGNSLRTICSIHLSLSRRPPRATNHPLSARSSQPRPPTLRTPATPVPALPIPLPSAAITPSRAVPHAPHVLHPCLSLRSAPSSVWRHSSRHPLHTMPVRITSATTLDAGTFHSAIGANQFARLRLIWNPSRFRNISYSGTPDTSHRVQSHPLISVRASNRLLVNSTPIATSIALPAQ